ncbi:hypothetical protein L218DRAFT_1009812 [Marasmius fiardii PR-910]|nr:hypothetical protein L218DRAFT_1009812 [Marasmius fiardii PR-910]
MASGYRRRRLKISGARVLYKEHLAIIPPILGLLALAPTFTALSLIQASPMTFVNSSGFKIEGGAYNNVYGSQFISNTIQVVQRQEKEHTVYDEFYNIQRGAVYCLQDVHCEEYPRRWDIGIRKWSEEGQLRVDRMISIATIYPHMEGSKFTVVAYNGPEANKAWTEDFQLFSNVWCVQLLVWRAESY